MPLQNYVIFQNGVPERLHFVDHVYDQITITDRITLKAVPRNRLVMTIDELNGSKEDPNGLPIIAKLSALAEGLTAKLEPYLPNKDYLKFDFVITLTGEGYLSKYTVQVIPRK